MNPEINISTDDNSEYIALRAEIRYIDRLCVTLLISLFTISGTFYSFLFSGNFSLIFLLPILSFVWVIGFFYITDKRFVILKIAEYLRAEIEDKKKNIYWENWLLGDRKDNYNNNNAERIQHPNTIPYFIEILSVIVILLLNFVLSFLLILLYYKLDIVKELESGLFYEIISDRCTIVIITIVLGAVHILYLFYTTKKSKKCIKLYINSLMSKSIPVKELKIRKMIWKMINI